MVLADSIRLEHEVTRDTKMLWARTGSHIQKESKSQRVLIPPKLTMNEKDYLACTSLTRESSKAKSQQNLTRRMKGKPCCTLWKDRSGDSVKDKMKESKRRSRDE